MAALVVAMGASLVDNFWPILNEKWQSPLLFLTLLVFLRWLDTTRKRVLAIEAGSTLRVYESASEFYGEALHGVSRGKRTIYAVFSHASAPHQHTEESRKYYAGTLAWARRNPGHRLLHRVIRLPAYSPDVQQWVDEQTALTKEVENYRVRVSRYPDGREIEGENFAVIDGEIVFLGFAMEDREELKGFSLRDRRVAAAFEQHFHELWRMAGRESQL